ncbi:hypothetical protein FDP41_000976 [Naegleria fowleri]|uniref:NADH dehydrogenase [ubiquinone] 1 beta subcomplex subunit 9 n=1 Tax=Naegleria fowleri TaxID=5763 RepID=A0A6A5BP77_NAEFO|nr:uncharacterized protein FDP41_000976 [Naegleria fowleri]KAF0979823.1 hypothetical protein FDP41_000976 [Naegleria fowleri]CAG4709926.1 unnamed protein product [Naegleria fowleri]
MAILSPFSQRIFKLYRRALREISYSAERDVFCVEARKIREEFEKYKGETDTSKIEFLLQRGEYWVEEYVHPDPYHVPDKEGGCAFLRYPDLDKEFLKNHSVITLTGKAFSHEGW